MRNKKKVEIDGYEIWSADHTVRRSNILERIVGYATVFSLLAWFLYSIFV